MFLQSKLAAFGIDANPCEVSSSMPALARNRSIWNMESRLPAGAVYVWMASALLVALVAYFLIWLASGSYARSDYILNISLWRHPQDSSPIMIELNFKPTGVLHIHEIGRFGISEIARLEPASEEAASQICRQLLHGRSDTGLRMTTTVGPGVTMRGRNGAVRGTWHSSARVEDGDLWDWIDRELEETKLKGGNYFAGSDATLLLIKDISHQYKIPDSVRKHLAVSCSRVGISGAQDSSE